MATPRARRDWQTLRAEIRSMLLEEDETNSLWSNTLLLTLFNHNYDRRLMELAEAHEGWVTDIVDTDIVANQREYSLPEGMGRLARVLIVYTSGRRIELTLIRDERWNGAYHAESSVGDTAGGLPTARLVGDQLFLEPPMSTALTNGLRFEFEGGWARLALTTDKIKLGLPVELETLLVYDTVVSALAIEGAQGQLSNEYVDDIKMSRDRIERAFIEYAERRFQARVFSEPFWLGD